MTEPAQTTPPPPAGDARPDSRFARLAVHPAFISLLLAAATLAVFYPVVHHQFVSFDDPDYVTANTHVKGGLTRGDVAWAFRASFAGNWHPLTWLSHMLDCQLYGLNPAGHHLTSLLLHAANAVLLFLLLRRLTGAVWRSAFVAALFALHPLRVESVAWVAERKDVLSAFFFMLTLCAYARYAEVRSQHPASSIRYHATHYYLLSLLCFALGLMSKPMLVTLPCVLLLLDYWPLQRLQLNTRNSTLKALFPLLREKIPFFLLSAASCLVTVLAQERAMQPLTNLSIGSRIGNALVAYVRYLGKTVWPTHLATPYPHPGHWPLPQVLLAAVLLIGLTLGALSLYRKLPFVPVGWFWFLGTLVPVIGLVQVGEQSMADRYSYLPLVGLFIILAWGARAAALRWQVPGVVLGVAAALVLFPCAWRARDQLRCWQNSESLYRHAVAVTKNNWISYYNLGSCLDAEGHAEEAMTNYFKAVEMQPNYPDPLNNIGCLLAGRKQFAEAVPFFEAALRANPDLVRPRQNLASALCELGKYSEAIPHLRRVVREKPEDTGALNYLANALARQGQFPEAIPYYEAALRVQPVLPATQYGLANALIRLHRTAEAIQHYRLAVAQKPDYAQARHDLGIALAREGKPDEALLQLREAVRAEPHNPVFLVSLAKLLAAGRQFEEAIPVYEEALRLRPENATAHFNLGNALAAQGKLDEARRHFSEALRLKPDFAAAQQALQALAASKPQ
jgi:tetratricopeptide (TPR) repeat protein